MSQVLITKKDGATSRPAAVSEEFVAQLTDSAFKTLLQHGQGSTIQLQLELWSALRGVVDRYFDIRPAATAAHRYPEVVYLGVAPAAAPPSPQRIERLAPAAAS